MINITKEYILNYLRENKEKFKQDFGVTKIALFGSYARDEQKEDSDIDILVNMPSKFKLYYNFKYFLEDFFHKKIDLGMEKKVRILIKKNIQKDIIYV